MKPIALYFHIPFCKSKCAYCDFASYPNREAAWARYFDALWTELESRAPMLREREVSTVFFGGGTPTLVDAEYIIETLNRARAVAPFAPEVEITMEGNPGALDLRKLSACRAAGVNRLSLGAQSFDDGLLKSIGRIHAAAEIGEAVRLAREAGFQNLNLDLIYALPGLTMAQWDETLSRAIELNVEHLSAYSLIVEPGTPMATRVESGEAVIPDDDAVNAMQRQATRRLESAGYARYEISNYARAGRQCRHNLTYWRRGDYLGIGCAAHSFVDGWRFENPAGLDEYIAGGVEPERHFVDKEEAMEEAVMLATRTIEGLNLTDWRRSFGADFLAPRAKIVQRLERAGYAEVVGDWFRLTERGLEVQSSIAVELLL